MPSLERQKACMMPGFKQALDILNRNQEVGTIKSIYIVYERSLTWARVCLDIVKEYL